MYTSCHNYGLNYGNVNKGHKANGFTTDGGFKQYAVNNINTLIKVPDSMTDEEATLVVTAGTTMYGLTELGGLIAGESLVVIGPGPIGLLGVAVAKALGAGPVILIGTRDSRLEIGKKLGADYTLNVKNEKDIFKQMKDPMGSFTKSESFVMQFNGLLTMGAVFGLYVYCLIYLVVTPIMHTVFWMHLTYMVSANIEPEALILPKTSNFSDGDDVPMPILLLAETIKVGESLMFASSL